jgi:hypothetical protein
VFIKPPPFFYPMVKGKKINGKSLNEWRGDEL